MITQWMNEHKGVVKPERCFQITGNSNLLQTILPSAHSLLKTNKDKEGYLHNQHACTT